MMTAHVQSLMKGIFLLFATCWIASAKSASPQINALRSNSMNDRVQLVLDVTGKTNVNFKLEHNPLRLIVDLSALPAKTYRNLLSFKNRGIVRLHTKMANKNTVRLAIELKKAFPYNVYAQPNRVVIDIYDRVNNPQQVQQQIIASHQVAKPAATSKAITGTHQVKNATDLIDNKTASNLTKKAEVTAVVSKQQDAKAVNNVDRVPATLAQTLPSKPEVSQSVPPAPISLETGIVDADDIDNEKTVVASLPAVTSSSSIEAKPVRVALTKSDATVANESVDWKSVGDKTVASKAKLIVPEEPIFKTKSKTLLVMIDPGHGGKDGGAVGKMGTREKDVVLQISKRLKDKIDAMPNLRAELTRSTDVYIPLRGRTRIARKKKADLFISIHADAFTRRDVHGSSVFILSTRGASSEAARQLAKRENSVDLKHGSVELKDYDPEISKVLMDIQQSATIESSYVLARKTLGQLKGIGKVHKRYVERAGFAVLKSADIPSMLVETAFISNPTEERKLRSPSYQDEVADAIAKGVQKYFAENLPHHILLGQGK